MWHNSRNEVIGYADMAWYFVEACWCGMLLVNTYFAEACWCGTVLMTRLFDDVISRKVVINMNGIWGMIYSRKAYWSGGLLTNNFSRKLVDMAKFSWWGPLMMSFWWKVVANVAHDSWHICWCHHRNTCADVAWFSRQSLLMMSSLWKLVTDVMILSRNSFDDVILAKACCCCHPSETCYWRHPCGSLLLSSSSCKVISCTHHILTKYQFLVIFF